MGRSETFLPHCHIKVTIKLYISSILVITRWIKYNALTADMNGSLETIRGSRYVVAAIKYFLWMVKNEKQRYHCINSNFHPNPYGRFDFNLNHGRFSSPVRSKSHLQMGWGLGNICSWLAACNGFVLIIQVLWAEERPYHEVPDPECSCNDHYP